MNKVKHLEEKFNLLDGNPQSDIREKISTLNSIIWELQIKDATLAEIMTRIGQYREALILGEKTMDQSDEGVLEYLKPFLYGEPIGDWGIWWKLSRCFISSMGLPENMETG